MGVGGIIGRLRFEREMLRDEQRTEAIWYQNEHFQFHKTGGIRGTLGTRLITSQERFTKGRYLVVTGEWAQESVARAKYEVFEPHRTVLALKFNRKGYRGGHLLGSVYIFTDWPMLINLLI